MYVLVTGTAGFIGSQVAQALLERGDEVAGIDCVNDYYDVRLKEARLGRLKANKGFTELRFGVEEPGRLRAAVAEFRPSKVIHLAAQAGVRYSITHPQAYIQANLVAFGEVLEACRHGRVEHLVYASSSSVYGANTTLPFSTHHGVDHPLSLYAATKRANELMAHSYSHIYGIPTTGLRFFTAYGPWGRPDMALFVFTKNILEGKPIDVFNRGKHKRDFTYIDDVVDGILRVLDKPATADPGWSGDPASSRAPYRFYNIGNNRPVELLRYIELIEQTVGKTAEKRLLDLQPGDVPEACADVADLERDFGWRPSTPVEVGVPNFVRWYREYYRV